LASGHRSHASARRDVVARLRYLTQCRLAPARYLPSLSRRRQIARVRLRGRSDEAVTSRGYNADASIDDGRREPAAGIERFAEG
jgi:hypothetical protein